MKPYDLNHIPFANNYDGNEYFEQWCIGDESKNEDIWHVNVNLEDGFATIDIVSPATELGLNCPMVSPRQPCWLVYGDSFEASNTEQAPDVPWFQDLQKVLKPWNGVKRDSNEFSIND